MFEDTRNFENEKGHGIRRFSVAWIRSWVTELCAGAGVVVATTQQHIQRLSLRQPTGRHILTYILVASLHQAPIASHIAHNQQNVPDTPSKREALAAGLLLPNFPVESPIPAVEQPVFTWKVPECCEQPTEFI